MAARTPPESPSSRSTDPLTQAKRSFQLALAAAFVAGCALASVGGVAPQQSVGVGLLVFFFVFFTLLVRAQTRAEQTRLVARPNVVSPRSSPAPIGERGEPGAKWDDLERGPWFLYRLESEGEQGAAFVVADCVDQLMTWRDELGLYASVPSSSRFRCAIRLPEPRPADLERWCADAALAIWALHRQQHLASDPGAYPALRRASFTLATTAPSDVHLYRIEDGRAVELSAPAPRA